jgi:protein-S-isoprenylcysteine O-methyltransferase Ste14
MNAAAVHAVLCWAVIGCALLVAPVLCLVTAPYGRHLRAGWGPTVGPTLGWILMEAPAPLGMAALFALGEQRSAPAVAFLVLFEVHYLNRAFVFPLTRRGTGRRVPLVMVALGFVFNCLNAYLNGRWLFHLAPPLGGGWLLDPRFLCGAGLFAAGLAMNLHADEALRRLRPPGASGYRVPEGGLFRYVSSPNYLGEIIEWSGWALLTFSLPGAAFAVFTAANLGPRALAHHAWYRRTFPDYPPRRKALIPFLL